MPSTSAMGPSDYQYLRMRQAGMAETPAWQNNPDSLKFQAQHALLQAIRRGAQGYGQGGGGNAGAMPAPAATQNLFTPEQMSGIGGTLAGMFQGGGINTGALNPSQADVSSYLGPSLNSYRNRAMSDYSGMLSSGAVQRGSPAAAALRQSAMSQSGLAEQQAMSDARRALSERATNVLGMGVTAAGGQASRALDAQRIANEYALGSRQQGNLDLGSLMQMYQSLFGGM